MNSFKFYIPLLVALLNLSYFETFANTPPEDEKSKVKALLKTLKVEVRNEAITRAEIFNLKVDKIHRQSPNKIADIDVVAELKELCGTEFGYNDNASANLNWPEVSCKFQPAKETLGGSTNKFLCNFNEVNKAGEKILKTRKVKYLGNTGIKNSETVPSLLASNVAKLLGFHTELYCPAIVNCDGCPHNNPYMLKGYKMRPSQETFSFPDSIVEHNAPGVDTMLPNIPRVHERRPHGLAWTDLKNPVATKSKSVREHVIEREAWMLWIHFIAEFDPHSSNQKLSCDKAKIENGDVYCERPVMFTQDYGQAFFRRFQFLKWKEFNPLVAVTDGTCRGGLSAEVFKAEKGNSPSDLYISAAISAEARDLLVSRLKNISDKQWIDIARISNIERLFHVKPIDFLNAAKDKIAAMETVPCLPYEAGKSVLFKAD